jgi:hypothetical protein
MWLESWDWDNFIKNKEKNYEASLSTDPMLKVEINKKSMRPKYFHQKQFFFKKYESNSQTT